MNGWRAAGAAASVALALLTAGCAEQSPPSPGGCNVRVELEGTIYRVHNKLNQAAPAGESLGPARLLDCDGKAFSTDQAFRVKGVDPRTALIVKSEAAEGVYVAEGLGPQYWPEELR